MNSHDAAKISEPARSTRCPQYRFILLLGGLLSVFFTPTSQAVCTIAATAVSFGNYNVFSPTALDSTGNINISCEMTMSYSVSLSAGAGSFTTRTLTSGPYLLNYNLYTDAARTLIWGDGSGGTSIVSNFALLANHSIYGQIPALQNAHIGTYSDVIIATITF